MNPWAQRKAAQEAKEAAEPAIPSAAQTNVSSNNNNDDDDNAVAGGAGDGDLDLPSQRDSRFNARNKNKTTRTHVGGNRFDAGSSSERQISVGLNNHGRTVTGFQSGLNYSLGKKKRWEVVREGQPLPPPAELGIVVPPNAVPAAVLPVVHTAANHRANREVERRVTVARAAANRPADAPANDDDQPRNDGWAVVRSRKGDVIKQKRTPGKKGVRRGGDDDDDDNDAPRNNGPRRAAAPAGGRSGDHPERRRRDQNNRDVQAQRREAEHQRVTTTAQEEAHNGPAPAVAFVSTVEPARARDGAASNWRSKSESEPRASNARVINKDIAAGRF